MEWSKKQSLLKGNTVSISIKSLYFGFKTWSLKLKLHHTPYIVHLHRSAKTLKPLTVNNIDHLFALQSFDR